MNKKLSFKGGSRKRVPLLILAASLMIAAAASMLIPTTETDAAAVTYVGLNGSTSTSPATTVQLNAPADFAALNYTLDDTGPSSGWYNVNNNIDISGIGETLYIIGMVYLIIDADRTLTVDTVDASQTTSHLHIYSGVPGVVQITGTLECKSSADGIGFADGILDNTARI
jgi:hypothetical protein